MRGGRRLVVVAMLMALHGCVELTPIQGLRCNNTRLCGEGLVCLGTRCAPIIVEPPPKSCADNADCGGLPKRKICKVDELTPQASICVMCEHDVHCPKSLVCVSNKCFPCRDDADCPSNLCTDFHCAACDSGEGLYCKDGLACQNGACVPESFDERQTGS